MNKKICVLVDALSVGGAEKAASILSKLFSNEGYQVSIVSLRDEITYDFGGKLFNLGEKEASIKFIKQFQKIFRLKKSLRSIDADYIIDFRMRNRQLMELVLYFFVFKSYTNKLIYRINSYNVQWHLPRGNFFNKIYSKEKIVAVSSGIKQILKTDYGLDNVTYIPNTFQFNRDLKEENKILRQNYIIAVGSLRNRTKQFDKLIDAYSKSSLMKKGYALYILGEGEDREILEKQINKLGLEKFVILLGFKNNPYQYVKKAKFLVLCSRVEGFPNVILEALNLNTPVVSFDCKSGPNEMIVDKENGLLVKNQDFGELQISMERLIEDSELYAKCKAQTHITLKKFNPNTILGMWKELFV